MSKQFNFLGLLLLFMLSLIILLEANYGMWFTSDKWNLVRRKGNLLVDIKKSMKSTETDEIIYYTRDSWGIRKTCQDIAKTNIITLGGSTTDERHVDDHETYSAKLQDFINSNGSGNACVANAGLDGHRLTGNYLSVKEWLPLIPNMHPKYYILYIGLNEAPLSSVQIKDNDGLLDGLKFKSAFYLRLQILADIMNQIFVKQAYIGHDIVQFNDKLYTERNVTEGIMELVNRNTEIFEYNLHKLLSEIIGKGAKVICVSQPHRMSKMISSQKAGIKNAFYHKGKWYNGLDFDTSMESINKAIQRSCNLPDCIYIDMYSENFENSDFYNYVHTNKSGSNKIARLIYEKTRSIPELSNIK